MQNSLGTVTAALQVQRGGITALNDNDLSASSSSDNSTINLPQGTQSTEQRPAVTNHYDSLTATVFLITQVLWGELY